MATEPLARWIHVTKTQTPKSRPYPDMVKNLDIMVFVLRDKDTMQRTLLITFDLVSGCQLIRPGVICLQI